MDGREWRREEQRVGYRGGQGAGFTTKGRDSSSEGHHEWLALALVAALNDKKHVYEILFFVGFSRAFISVRECRCKDVLHNK